MELKEYLQTLWKWSWLIVLCTLCAGAASFIASSRLPPVYEAKALFVWNQSPNAGILDYSSLLGGQRMIETYRELLKTRSVLDTVIANLDLPYSTQELTERIWVKVIPDTQLLELRVEDNDPQRAADIANEIAFTFLVLRSAERQLEEIEGYEESVVGHMEALEQAIETARNKIEQMQASPTLGTEERLVTLQTSQSGQQAAYANLLTAYLNIRAMKSRLLDLAVAESAHPPSEPIRPRKMLNTVVAGLSGCMIGLAVAFLQEYLADTLEDSEDLREALSLPSLGTIPVVRSWQKHGRARVQAKDWPVGDALRILRTNIQFASVDSTVRTLLITSAGPQEGKTSIVANLGTVLAQSAHKVLLVDADLRRPALHRRFDLPNANGLTSVLLDYADLDRCIAETGIPNLYVLPSGPLPPNPVELVGSQRMSRLVEELQTLADVVLFDSPPVLACADATVLASQTDGVVLVVQSGSTRRDAAKRALEMLRKPDAKVLGGVLNKVRARSSEYYYYYYSNGGNKEKPFWARWPALVRQQLFRREPEDD